MATYRVDVSTIFTLYFFLVCLIFPLIFVKGDDGLDRVQLKDGKRKKRQQPINNQVPQGPGDPNFRGGGNQFQNQNLNGVNLGGPNLGPLPKFQQGQNLMLQDTAGQRLGPNGGIIQQRPDQQNWQANSLVGKRQDQPVPPQNPVQNKYLHAPSKDLKSKLARPMRIAEVPPCVEDYNRICRTVSKGNNFAVLECLQNSRENQDDLSLECNQFLWDYKKNLTVDPRFDQAAFQVCTTDLKQLKDCKDLTKGEGDLLPCLFDLIENITDTHCRQYLNRMKVITFSDYRLIKGFYLDCEEDIRKSACANVKQSDTKQQTEPTHSQGRTIECLQDKVAGKKTKISKKCAKQILRVTELQADDYHADRQLYFACQADRERFCSQVPAGEGMVYKCLIEHKTNVHMSDGCRDKLAVRQRVIAKDYKADMQLIGKCRKEIHHSRCSSGDTQSQDHALSRLLICLEDWADEQADNPVSGDCEAELFDIRKSLLEDYMVNPEVVTECESAIQEHCRGLRKQGKTLHCLMGMAKRDILTESCRDELMDLIEETRAGNDYRMDNALSQSCGKSVSVLCPKIKAGDARVLSCLMDAVDDPQMDEACAEDLLELQYFISRDFKLDPVLFKNCASDADTLCHMQLEDQNKHPEGLVLACLHRHLHPDKENAGLSPSCANQVHRVIRQRAVSVHLNPKVEEKCRGDMGRFCPGIESKKKKVPTATLR